MKTNTILAVYAVAADYYSGQWSRGYRVLCTAGRRLQAKGISGAYLERCLHAIRKTRQYEKLAREYANKL